MKKVVWLVLIVVVSSLAFILFYSSGAGGRGFFSWGWSGLALRAGAADGLGFSAGRSPAAGGGTAGRAWPAGSGETGGINPAVASRFSPGDFPKIPILMYHRLGEPADGLTVTPKDFALQMKFLADRGYRTITLGRFLEWQQAARQEGDPEGKGKGDGTTGSPGQEVARGGAGMPAEKVVILTFDDGYDSVYRYAFPVLKEYHFTATVFPIVGMLGRKGFLQWNQMQEMAAYGIEFGSHTWHHLDLRTLQTKELEREVDQSRQFLERALGQPVRTFCYPSGKYNQEVLAEVRRAGYLGAVTTEYGAATFSADPYRLKRVRIDGREGLKVFAAKIINLEPKVVAHWQEGHEFNP